MVVKVDVDTFAIALIQHHDGISYEEIAAKHPPYTASQLEKVVNDFLVDIHKLTLTNTARPATVKKYIHYEDLGCYKSKSCFSCSLPTCIYDREGYKNIKKHRWTELENAYLIENYPHKTIREMAFELKIPEHAIREHVSIMGIKKEPQRGNSNEERSLSKQTN